MFREYVGRMKRGARKKMLGFVQRAKLNKYLKDMGDRDMGLVYVECKYAKIKGTTVLDVYSHGSEVCGGCENYLICDDLVKRNESGKVERVMISVITPSTISEN